VAYKSQDLSVLESKLQRSLRPVSPRPDFISELRKQLANQLQMLPTVSRFGRSSVLWLGFLLILLILGGFLLTLRSAILLISIATLLQQSQRQKSIGRDPGL
jgi:hypothetical protein